MDLLPLDSGQLATKTDLQVSKGVLRADIAELRSELRSEVPSIEGSPRLLSWTARAPSE